MDQLDFSLKYPFTATAKQALSESKLELNERIVELACERIKNAMREKKERTVERITIHESGKLEELAAFAASRMILGHMKNRFITNKFAVTESKRISAILETEDEKTVLEIGKELEMGEIFSSEKSGNGSETVKMKISTYLKFSPRALPYKLINRHLENGFVTISWQESIRLMEEAIRKRMMEIPIVKQPPEIIKKAVPLLIAEMPKQALPVTSFKEGDHPPCIEKLLDAARKHENLNHQARWYLAVYLLSIGLDIEKINAIYTNLPDYNERTTRYQLEHAKKRAYTVPSCASVTTYGFCVADCRIGNPINWHNRRDNNAGKR